MLRKFDTNKLYTCPPHLYTVATLPWEIQKSHFSRVLFIHIPDYLRYLRRKQTFIPLSPHLKNVTALPCKMQNLFIWLKVMLRSTTLYWNLDHVATRLFHNSSISQIGIRYTSSYSIQTQLYQPQLHWVWSKTQSAVLPRRVADAEAATRGSTALLDTMRHCKAMHQHIVLVPQSNFCDVRHPSCIVLYCIEIFKVA